MEKNVWQDKKHFMWFPISFTNYTLTQSRLLVKSGLLSNDFEEAYLYRIVDVRLRISLLQKIFGTGTVTLVSNDASTPVSELKNIKNAYEVKEMISKMANEERNRRRVLEMNNMGLNLDDANGDGFPDFIS